MNFLFPVMNEYLLHYLYGVGITSGFLVIWFETTIVVHISKLLKISKDDIFTFDDWSDDLLVRSPFFGELLSCPLCLGFWASLFVSICIQQVNELSYWFIPICIFSWPVFIFSIFKADVKGD